MSLGFREFLAGIDQEYGELQARAAALRVERAAREHDALIAEHFGRDEEAAAIRGDFAARASAACYTCLVDGRAFARAEQRGDVESMAELSTTCMDCGRVSAWSCIPGHCSLCAHSPRWVPLDEAAR